MNEPSMKLTSCPATTVLVGRQPIYGRNMELFAYELLFRGDETNQATILDGDHATAQVVLNAFSEIGLDQIVNGYLAFVNITRSFLVEGHCLSLPKERVVLEVLETIAPDREVVTALTNLVHTGYQIALDDFVYQTSLQSLVDLAKIIKVDVLALSREAIQVHVQTLRQYPVKLLAEKVETHEDFRFCRDMGFDYFQGYFFCKPNIVRAHRIPGSRLAVLTLLAELQDPDVRIQRIQEIIKQDLSLSYKILKYVNSAFFSLPRKVDSINQAVCMVGLERLKIWTSLLLLSKIEEKPLLLLMLAVTRAKMCEQLALAQREPRTDQYFTVGLLSVLDGLFDQSMEELVASLPLATEIVQALLHREGLLGETLACVVAYEQGDWEVVTRYGVPLDVVKKAFLEAVTWTTTLLPLLEK
ncbi:MAG: HDOD domain-containing protein [Nitrospirae bacterium]|nr:MAG: HDOD domain-containing protein [Nitrospirota bacterium]